MELHCSFPGNILKVSQHLLSNRPLSAAALIKSISSFRKMPRYPSYKSNKLELDNDNSRGWSLKRGIFKNQRKSLTLYLPVLQADEAETTAAFSSRLKGNHFNTKLCILFSAQGGLPGCLLHPQFCSVKLSSSFHIGISTTVVSSIWLLQWLSSEI